MTPISRSSVTRTLSLAALLAGLATSFAPTPLSAIVRPSAGAVQTRRDSMTVTIDPTKRIEVKLVMKKGQKAEFEWKSDGAEVAYNLHAEVPKDPSVKAHTYQRGASAGEKGSIEAVFDGVHGWSWRNTGEKPVTITVKATGQFSELKKM
jgi:serine/threonine protein kinase HipA of HipAB toxin-antitoxin module